MHGYSTINGLRFARCVKQDGFYTFHLLFACSTSLLGVLNKMGSILQQLKKLGEAVC